MTRGQGIVAQAPRLPVNEPIKLTCLLDVRMNGRVRPMHLRLQDAPKRHIVGSQLSVFEGWNQIDSLELCVVLVFRQGGHR